MERIWCGFGSGIIVRTKGSSRGANMPAAGNAGIASQLTIGRHWPGVPEPERRIMRGPIFLACCVSLVGCAPRAITSKQFNRECQAAVNFHATLTDQVRYLG